MSSQNTLKVSYCYRNKIDRIIDGHNKSILTKQSKAKKTAPTRTRNCRQPQDCPLSVACLSTLSVDQTALTTAENNQTNRCVGLAEIPSKLRFANYRTSFQHRSERNSTELRKNVGERKDQGKKKKHQRKKINNKKKINRKK